MSLSSSTLSLKFMQRGLARSTPTKPGSASASSTPGPTPSTTQQGGDGEGSQSTSMPKPAYLTPEASAALRGDKLVREEEGIWYAPRRDRPASAYSGERERDGPVFESSYVPFLSGGYAGPSSSSVSTPTPSASGGGGRMTFGGFGQKEDEVAEEGDEDEEMEMDGDEERDVPRAQAVDVKREKGKMRAVKAERSSTPSQIKPERDAPTTFLRPNLSPPPSSSKAQRASSNAGSTGSTGARPLSVAEKMRATISSRSSTSKPERAGEDVKLSTVTDTAPSLSSTRDVGAGSPKAEGKKKKEKKRSASTLSLSSELGLGSGRGSEAVGNKKIKVEPSGAGSNSQAKAKVDKGGKGMGTSLDEREKAMKAEKKAKKRAKAAEGGA